MRVDSPELELPSRHYRHSRTRGACRPRLGVLPAHKASRAHPRPKPCGQYEQVVYPPSQPHPPVSHPPKLTVSVRQARRVEVSGQNLASELTKGFRVSVSIVVISSRPRNLCVQKSIKLLSACAKRHGLKWASAQIRSNGIGGSGTLCERKQFCYDG